MQGVGPQGPDGFFGQNAGICLTVVAGEWMIMRTGNCFAVFDQAVLGNSMAPLCCAMAKKYPEKRLDKQMSFWYYLHIG